MRRCGLSLSCIAAFYLDTFCCVSANGMRAGASDASVAPADLGRFARNGSQGVNMLQVRDAALRELE